MVLISYFGKAIAVRFWRQGEIKFRVELASVEGRGAYQRIWFEVGTYQIYLCKYVTGSLNLTLFTCNTI